MRLLNIGRYGEAREMADKALATEPDSRDALWVIAVASACLYDTQRHEAAAARMVALDPTDSIGHQQLALALSRGGQHTEALRHAHETVGLNANDRISHYTLASVLIGLPPDLMGDAEEIEAWEAASRAVELAPDDAAMHYTHARVAVRLGLPDVAQTALLRTLEISPDHAQALQMMAIVRLHRSKVVDAANLLGTSLAVAPESGFAQQAMGLVVLALTRKAQWAAAGTVATLFPLVMSEYPGRHAGLWPMRATAAIVFALVWGIALARMLYRLRGPVRRYLFRYAWRNLDITPRLGPPLIATLGALLAGLIPTPAATVCVICALATLLVGRLLIAMLSAAGSAALGHGGGVQPNSS